MMGTEYYVACRDCKKVRGLDKFYTLTTPADTRADALALGGELQKKGWAFRCALLTSFLWQHKGHNCTVFSEHDDEFMTMVPLADKPEPGDYEDDSDKFWTA
jgi:hypothetical protein